MSLVRLIEVEIQWLKNIILPEIMRNGRLLDNYSESQQDTFKIKDIQVNIIGNDEAYMLTQCYRVNVKFEYAGVEEQRKLIVKKTPKVSPDTYDAVQFNELFSNEIRFYTEILPIIQEQSKGKFAAPKYYYSEIKPYSALIILEDFAVNDWRVTKDRVGLSLEHARIAVKYLGTFHGFGYAIKHNQPQLFQELASKLREARFVKDISGKEWNLKQKTSLKRAAEVVAKYQPQVDKEFVRKFQLLTYSYVGYGRQRVAPREPLSTLCHGDYLRNNIAYKYEKDNTSGEPMDIMMFDYQTLRHSSPMIDLSLFLALSTFAEVRYQHFDSIFDDYCNALFESYRKQCGKALPEYLNRQELLKEYIRFMPYATLIAGFFLYSLVEPEEISPAENFNYELTEAQIIERAMVQGGEIVDREIAHQIKEMLEQSRLHNVKIDEDIDASQWMEGAKKYFE